LQKSFGLGILFPYPSEEEGHPVPMHGDYDMSPRLLQGWDSSLYEHRVTLSTLSLSVYLSICLSVSGDAASLARTVIIKLTMRRRQEGGDWRERN
jgi:hypothetical protein